MTLGSTGAAGDEFGNRPSVIASAVVDPGHVAIDSLLCIIALTRSLTDAAIGIIRAQATAVTAAPETPFAVTVVGEGDIKRWLSAMGAYCCRCHCSSGRLLSRSCVTGGKLLT